MFKKRLIIASYSLIYLGLFSFTYWITWLLATQVVITNLSKFSLTLGEYLFYILNSLGALFVWKDSE